MKRLRLIEYHGRAIEVTARAQWEPHDLWIGCFWKHSRDDRVTGSDMYHGAFRGGWTLHLYVCVLPLLPIHVYIVRRHYGVTA